MRFFRRLLPVLVALAPAAASAQLRNPLPSESLPQLIGLIARQFIGIVGALALAMFVWGGFLWLTSGGSPDKIKKGKDTMVWAAVGIIIVFTSYSLVRFVFGLFSK